MEGRGGERRGEEGRGGERKIESLKRERRRGEGEKWMEWRETGMLDEIM